MSATQTQDRSQIEEIKEKLDIVQVGETYLSSMKRSGPNYFAPCPFHNEKTPSFSINQDLQIFKCFGCGESGDVITFIQKIEGLDFPKALEKAAQMAGVVLKQRAMDPARDKRAKEKQKIIEVNTLAAKYFNHILLNHKMGAKALEYSKARKLTKKVLEKFQIGFAPTGYENLKKFLTKKGYEEDDLARWGLLVKRDNKIYDKFRNRLMFPIFNHQGDVVGFSGRQIEKSDFGPKYLNSPETPVYKKKETLYGLFQARDSVRRKGFAIMVEGNVDILSSHRVGVENIVCPLGTALTVEQCKLIRRYADKLYFALDTDEAGEKALLRGLEFCEQVGLETLAIDLGEFLDADELIVAGAKKWQEAIDNPQEIIEHLIGRFSSRIDIATARGKAKFVQEIGPYLRAVQDPIVQKEYVKNVAVVAEIDEDLVLKGVGQSASVQPTEEDRPTVTSKPPRKISKKEFLAAMLIQNKDLSSELKNLDEIFESWFLDFLEDLNKGKELKTLISDLEESKATLLQKLALIDLGFKDLEELPKEAKKMELALRKQVFQKQIKDLEKKIKKSEIAGQEYENLIREVKKKTVQLKKLSSSFS